MSPNQKYKIVWTLGRPVDSQDAFHSAKDLYRWLTRNGKVEAVQILNQMRPVIYVQYIGEPEYDCETGPAYETSRVTWKKTLKIYEFSDPNKALDYLEVNQASLDKGASQNRGKPMGLRKRLIRLAHVNPKLRPEILSLVKKADERLFGVLRLDPTDQKALDSLYKEFEHGRVNETQIQREVPQIWKQHGVSWILKAFGKSPGNDRLYKMVRDLYRNRLIDDETLHWVEQARDYADYEQHYREMEEEKFREQEFEEETIAENDAFVKNWLRQLPRLAKRYFPELANMRLKIQNSVLDIDGADGSYETTVVILSPELVAIVKEAQRNNGDLLDRHRDRQFERFAEAATELLQETVDNADEESIFWLEEMDVLGRDTSSFRLWVGLWSYDEGPGY